MSREENRAMAPDLRARAELIVEASELFSGNDSWDEFFQGNDLGVPYAYLVVGNHGTLTAGGEAILHEAWMALCDRLGADPDRIYESLDNMMGG